MRIGLGETLLLAGNRQGAMEYFRQALEICRELHDWRGEAEALRRIADLELSLGNLQEARNHMESAIDIIESVRGRLAGSDFRAAYSATKRDFYESYIDLVMRTHGDAAALEAAERSRMRSFVEMLNETRVDIRQGVDPALIEQERTLRQQINVQQQALLSASGNKARPAAAAEADQRLKDSILRYEQTEANIRARSPAYAALTHPHPLTLTEIQRLLDPETVLLEYWLGEKSSYVWAVGKDTVAAYALPGRRRIET